MLIQILHETQEAMGYLPQDVQQCIADELKMPPAEVYSVVTFYSRFTMTPKGLHTISVCLGTACYVKGAEAIIEKLKKTLAVGSGQTTADGVFTLDICRCVGACNKAPVVYVDNDQHEFVTPELMVEILSHYRDDQEYSAAESIVDPGLPEQEEAQL
jgi:NADH:ubiquinone oxidoreductase subunit E